MLFQPSEMVTILGAAAGTLLIASPMHIVKAMIGQILGVLKGSPYIGIEDDIEKPKESEIFKQYPAFLADHHPEAFVCDTLRTAITGGVEPFDMDQMMELDMEIAHHEVGLPIQALSTVADALPGLGIVAAVLGVVITMGALGGPPEEIGKKVAAALVGTFLGILLCYGVVGPLAASMTKIADDQNSYLHVIRVVILAFLKGMAPILAIEMGRRAILLIERSKRRRLQPLAVPPQPSSPASNP